MSIDWLERISPCVRDVVSGEPGASCTGYADTSSDWVEPLRVIYDHELVIFNKGGYGVEIEGVDYPCPQHSYIIVPCGRLHASWSTGQRGRRYWTHFDWAWQDSRAEAPIYTYHPAQPHTELYHHAPSFVPNHILHGQISAPEKICEMAERLCAMQHFGNSHDKLISRALLLDILLELLHTNEPEDSASSPSLDPAFRARELIKQSIDRDREPLSLQDLLGGLGYSYPHLCRSFRKRFGIAPMKYVHALRIGRAKTLLSDTNLSISEIAYRAGFNDSVYFTQLFKRMTGLTPSMFRRAKWTLD